jgi:hypothetical protein
MGVVVEGVIEVKFTEWACLAWRCMVWAFNYIDPCMACTCVWHENTCITGKYKNLLLFIFPSHEIIVNILNPVLLYGCIAGS